MGQIYLGTKFMVIAFEATCRCVLPIIITLVPRSHQRNLLPPRVRSTQLWAGRGTICSLQRTTPLSTNCKLRCATNEVVRRIDRHVEVYREPYHGDVKPGT